MSHSDKETSTNKSSRPACMPSNKEDGFLPSINLRGTPSSDSDADYRRDQNGGLLLSNENSSLTPSPVKFPNIGRSISTSVSSLTRLKDREKRELLCRSPSCPSNIGGLVDRHEFENEGKDNSKGKRAQLETDLKLPCIFNDCKNPKPSYLTPRNTATKPKLSSQTGQLSSRGTSPPGNHIAEKIAMGMKRDPVATPRDESSIDTHRSNNQSALLLPLRNTENRKSKRKRKNGHYRQNTQLSVKSDSAACDGNSAKDVVIGSSRSEYNGHSPVRELGGHMLSESDDHPADKSSDPVHQTYHVATHSNKHQMRMKDLAKVKA